MKIDGNRLFAEDGMAIHRKGEPSPTRITRVALGPSDSADNWEDCEYGDTPSPDESTMEDKDAALRRFGVEV